jgi:drug/metabolite transporter (DMT)-like permease
VLILSEPFTAATLTGGALIACAVLMLQWNGKPRERIGLWGGRSRLET